MARHSKKNKFKRYLSVYKRKIKKLNRKKVICWLRKNLKTHPFILCLLSVIWLNVILTIRNFTKENIARLIGAHLAVIISWLFLVVLSNLLRDKNAVRWYLRKRFVFVMLVLFSPLGLILLWSGSKFTKITKIICTVIFVSIFIISQVYYSKRYEKLLSKGSVEKVIELITKPKKKIYLKTINEDVLSGLQFSAIPKNAKSKLAVSDIAARVIPGTVSIRTIDKRGEEIGEGSGFVISGNGIIVTNFHVLEAAHRAEIKIGEKEFKEAGLIKSDSSLDIALLKVDAESLPVLPLGDSDDLVNGQVVVVLGNPWGFEHSVSTGVISGIRAKDDIKLIQMTAPVSPGSSGGPVIDEYGQVVGITTVASLFLAQNLNFAIPINNLKKLIDVK